MRRGLAQSHRGTEPDRLEGISVALLGEWALMSCAQTDRRHTPYSLAPFVAAIECGLPHRYASADGPAPPHVRWIDELWDAAARPTRASTHGPTAPSPTFGVQHKPGHSGSFVQRGDCASDDSRGPLMSVGRGGVQAAVGLGLVASRACTPG